MSSNTFDSLDLSPALLDNLGSLGYHEMTPVQAESLPLILAGRDVMAQARTGSGKTAAFGLGLLERLNVGAFHIQSLILCPTRELADQVGNELRRLARGVHNVKILNLYGGVPIGPQIGSLEHGAHIIVGTPGRVDDHLRKGSLSLEHLGILVLDEADRMLDMGFQETLEAIIGQLPARRQTLLFSATFPAGIQRIASQLMTEPVTVRVDTLHDSSSIRQTFHRIEDESERLTALRLLLLEYRPDSALVFCNTRKDCEWVAAALRDTGFSALPLHGELDQKDRDQTLVRFTNRSISVLVATDVAARGLDIEALDAVVNYQLARDPDIHTHRIGRTGRAGARGMASSLFTAAESFRFDKLTARMEEEPTLSNLPPDHLLKQPAYRPPMITLQIDGGRKKKLRPGDIVGALTAADDIGADDVGRIHIFDNFAYVAVKRNVAASAEAALTQRRMKGRSFRARVLSGVAGA